MSKCYNSELPIGPPGPQGPPGTSPTITSTDGSIEIDNTNPSAPDLSIPSGEWTPTISAETNLSPITVRNGWYTKIGNIVKASISISIGFQDGENEMGFAFTLPIDPNNDFASQYEIVGVSSSNGQSVVVGLECFANTGTKQGQFIILMSTADTPITPQLEITYSVDN